MTNNPLWCCQKIQEKISEWRDENRFEQNESVKEKVVEIINEIETILYE